MRTPICDFVRDYAESGTTRLHMPGHKGIGEIEKFDLTEIKGADSLYEADGIIAESEANVSALFGADSFYSTEGSSHAIRAMLHLACLWAKGNGKAPLILAARNAHRVFISAVAMLGISVEWLPVGDSYISSPIDPELLACKLDSMIEKPFALYITSPDYLGVCADIAAVAAVCKERGVLLLVDNAHGAYLKFLPTSEHPMDLGADMCTDSAHKTLPVLTGGAYLHISKNAPASLKEGARAALALYGSTSPSYLILASLDKVNPYLESEFSQDLSTLVSKIDDAKATLIHKGYTVVGGEKTKITVAPKAYGYLGTELADEIRAYGMEPEFADADYAVFMLSPRAPEALGILENALLSIKRKNAITDTPPALKPAEQIMSIREATFSPSVTLPLCECVGRVLAIADVGCPPAVPILVPGERIEAKHIDILSYYGKDTLTVVK